MNQFYLNDFKEYYDYSSENKDIWDQYILQNKSLTLLNKFTRKNPINLLIK